MGPSQQLASSKSPECGTVRTFRFTVSLKRESHKLSSSCAHRFIMDTTTCSTCYQECTYLWWLDRFTPIVILICIHPSCPPRRGLTRTVYYIRKPRPNPPPCKPSRHARGDPGQTRCDASFATGSTVHCIILGIRIKSYAPYGRNSRWTTGVGVHSYFGAMR